MSRHQDDPTERVEHFLGFKTFFSFLCDYSITFAVLCAVCVVCTLTFCAAA